MKTNHQEYKMNIIIKILLIFNQSIDYNKKNVAQKDNKIDKLYLQDLKLLLIQKSKEKNIQHLRINKYLMKKVCKIFNKKIE